VTDSARRDPQFAASFGKLQPLPALQHPELLARPVSVALHSAATAGSAASQVQVAEIDPSAADTAEFCDRYGVALDQSANCVVVAGRRSGETRFAACVVLATTRADVNNVVRRLLDVRKASFASMDVAVAETGMEYGGITPIGLPTSWPVLVDAAVVEQQHIVLGSGLRRSKLLLPGRSLVPLTRANLVEGLAQ
jgi:prolyl-tRNA editing enzyme YbaK/EbsC (Cys-tRNA(Pro) deacylase)